MVGTPVLTFRCERWLFPWNRAIRVIFAGLRPPNDVGQIRVDLSVSAVRPVSLLLTPLSAAFGLFLLALLALHLFTALIYGLPGLHGMGGGQNKAEPHPSGLSRQVVAQFCGGYARLSSSRTMAHFVSRDERGPSGFLHWPRQHGESLRLATPLTNEFPGVGEGRQRANPGHGTRTAARGPPVHP